MLVSTKEMLQRARREGYAVPTPNFFDFRSASAYLEVAEALNKPLILAFAQAHMDQLGLEDAAMIGRYLAKKASVPVALAFRSWNRRDDNKAGDRFRIYISYD